MSIDDNTKDLTADLPKSLTTEEKLDWLMETLQRFMARDTNPLPPNYAARFMALEERLGSIERLLAEFKAETNRSFKLLREDIFQGRQVHAALEERVEQLERRAA